MKKCFYIVMVLGLSLMTAQADQGLKLFGAYWEPDGAADGYGFGAALKVGGDPIYFSLRGTYFGDMSEDIGPIDIDLEVIPAEAGIGFNLPLAEDKVTLYGGAGLGYYFLDTDESDVDDEVGWYLEGGLELQVNKSLSVFGEVLWRYVEGTAENDKFGSIEDDADIDLDGVGFNVGIIIR